MKRNLENRLNASQIVSEAGMSTHPEFYSGRGAISCDLNDKILEKIYSVIQEEHGKDAAKQYAQMVADIPKLSATDFLNTLYALESHDWKWDKKLQSTQNGLDVGPDCDDGSRFAIGMATVANVMFGSSERDETKYIRIKFLYRHGIEISESACKTNYSH